MKTLEVDAGPRKQFPCRVVGTDFAEAGVRSKGPVLLVENMNQLREELGAWLSEEGYEVLSCPGPRAPEYTCIGGRGGSCPLANAAELVVLDGCLASDIANIGSPSWRLMDYYLGKGKKVLTLVEDGVGMGLFNGDGGVQAMDRHSGRARFVAAVRKMMGDEAEPVDEESWIPTEDY